jgi:hypothetical protein
MDADHELKMNLSRREIRVLLLHKFRLGHKAMEAANNICSTMGEDVLSTRTVQHWFNLRGKRRDSGTPVLYCTPLVLRLYSAGTSLVLHSYSAVSRKVQVDYSEVRVKGECSTAEYSEVRVEYK